MEPGRIPNYVIKGVLAICPISYKVLLRPRWFSCLLQSIVFLLVKTETYFIKADARALPSEGEIVVLMGIQSD